MQKTTTSLNKTDSLFKKKLSIKEKKLQPQKETLDRILQFASSYRVQQISENQFVELFLN